MPRTTPVIKGLYAITPDGMETSELLRRTRQALAGGAGVLQYRSKANDASLRLGQALALRALTREFSVPLIVNDDVRLAAEVDADGVHLGEADESLAAARALLGEGKIIGLSCYNRLSLAVEAVRAGADYVAFGSFYQSGTKPGAARADIGILCQARLSLAVPIVAIGGINALNGAELVQAGADALAVITALFGADDGESAARAFTELFKQGTT